MEMEMERYGRRKKPPPKTPPLQQCRRPKPRIPEERPAFDATPFDPSSGSAWETLPTKSIFDSEPSRNRGRARDTDWLSSPYPEDTRRTDRRNVPSTSTANWLSSPYDDDDCYGAGAICEPSTSNANSYSLPRRIATARGKSATPPKPKKVLPKISASRAPTRASGLDAGCSSGPSGSTQTHDCLELEPDFRYAYPYAMMMFGPEDDDLREWFAKSKRQEVDTSPLPPWKPCYASERLEAPDNPPPMFHPAFNNDWRYDPNISDDIRAMYDSSLNEFSSNFCIFDYGQLSEYNTLNVYAPENLLGFNDDEIPTGPQMDDGLEVFGDPHEALARPVPADVPDKYRKEKYHYYELKKRLELFKKLGMEDELSMYKGRLERMEADPWTGDTSGGDVEVYVRGGENDPAYDDDLLERMEELCSPSNEGLRAFWEAMANPPPIRDECSDDDQESGFKTANNASLGDSFQSSSDESDSSLLNRTFTLPGPSDDMPSPSGLGSSEC